MGGACARACTGGVSGTGVVHAPRVGVLGVRGASEVSRIRRLVGVRDLAARVRPKRSGW